MENIPHTFIGYSPLFLIATLLIFAIFTISVLFILGQYRKKPFKVRRRPAVDLSPDTLHDILAFFDRKCLSRLRSVDSSFNRTIQREFANKPYLVLKKFSIEEFTNIKIVHERGRCIGDEETVDNILAEKFVRFKHADVECNDRDHVTHLLSTSEPWQTFDLKISAKFKLTKYNARRLAKCKNVNSISFSGRLTLLPELFLGNCLRLHISDNLFKTANSASVPWMKILDFLFRPNESYLVRNFLEIKTKNPPGAEEYLQFIDAMKQEDVLPRTGRMADFWNEGIDQFLAYTQIDCMAGSPADRMVNTYAIRLRTIVRNGACGHLGAVSLMDECKFSIMDTLQRKCGHVIDSHGEPLIDYDGDVKSMCIVMKKAEDCVIPLMEKRCGYLSKLSYEYYTQMNLARFNLLFGLHGEGEPVARCSCFDNPNTNGLCEMPSEGCHHIISVNYERDMDPDARSDCMRYWRLLKASMMEDFITTTSTTTTTTTTTIPTTITTTTQTTSYENTTTMTTNMPVIEHRNMGHSHYYNFLLAAIAFGISLYNPVTA